MQESVATRLGMTQPTVHRTRFNTSLNVWQRLLLSVALLIGICVLGTGVVHYWTNQPPGDYETELGTLRLEDGHFEMAMAHYDNALLAAPVHRGAMMGRALVLLQTEDYSGSIAQLSELIDTLDQEKAGNHDGADRAVLAAAYANRGIARDRMGDYERALADYAMSLKTDEKIVSGPGVIRKILYGSAHVSTVRSRAVYLYEQLQKPEVERVMRVPRIDALQRMHRPR